MELKQYSVIFACCISSGLIRGSVNVLGIFSLYVTPFELKRELLFPPKSDVKIVLLLRRLKTAIVMPDLIRHPVDITVDSGFRRNDNIDIYYCRSNIIFWRKMA